MRKLSLAAAALMAAAAGMGSVVVTDGPNRVLKSSVDGNATVSKVFKTGETDRRSTANEFASGAWARLRRSRSRRAAYGWTNAHQKRVARKARNVKKSRK